MTSQEKEQEQEMNTKPIPEEEGNELTIDYSKMKKKKKKNKKANESVADSNTEVASAETNTRTEDEMYIIHLNRLFTKLYATRDTSKPRIIKPQISNQGSGKGRSTIIHNYISFMYSLHTKPTMTDFKERSNHLTLYITHELCCKGHISNEKLVLNGKFTVISIENILKNYIALYVRCKCSSYNTNITRCSIRREHKNTCESCRSEWSLMPIVPKAKPKAEDKDKSIQSDEQDDTEVDPETEAPNK